jgi:hypothetical protein
MDGVPVARIVLGATAMLGTFGIVAAGMALHLEGNAILSLAIGLVGPITAIIGATGRIEAAKLAPPATTQEHMNAMVSTATTAATTAAITSVSQMPVAMPVAPYSVQPSPVPGAPRTTSQTTLAAVTIPRAPSIPDIPEPKDSP